MTRSARCGLFALALICVPTIARAQLGELHLGALLSYGAAGAYGLGAGLVLGVAPGRLSYVGLRWAYHAGDTESSGAPTAPVEVESRVQVFALDLGLMFPVGPLEIVPGVSLGAARFTQRATQPGTSGEPVSVRDHAVEFLAAPSLSVHARVARVLFIPELQYCLAGHPDLSWRAPHRGPVASLRIVLPIEIDRIRH